MAKLFSSRRMRASFAGLSVLALGLTGCGGGSGGGNNNGGTNNSSLPNVNLTVLTANNRLAIVNARTPNTVQQLTLTGLRTGENLIGIDVRYPNTSATSIALGTTLYGLGNLSGSYQLYRLLPGPSNTLTATAVGVPFTLPVTLGNIGFDFNPAADRIRVVDAATRTNLRLNPDTGAVVDADTVTPGLQLDGTLVYDASDVNNGSTPIVSGAAYTNNDGDTGTGTVNYAIDLARRTLVTQGDNNDGVGADTGVSPNTGRLFTVGSLGITPGSGDVGFDISPNVLGTDGNRALIAVASRSGARPRLYEVSLSTGQLTGGAFINVPSVAGVLDIAVTFFNTN